MGNYFLDTKYTDTNLLYPQTYQVGIGISVQEVMAHFV